MGRAGRRAGVIIGGVAGVGAAVLGAAAVAAERYAIGRYRSGPDPEADQEFGRLPADRRRVVLAADGTPLHVEEIGPPDAALTVVFGHGYANSLGTWHYQRLGLAEMEHPSLRMVFYDQRGHGRSGRSPRERSTIDQLGDDLAAVLDEVVPSGPVALVGHSMGGMTIMALAGRRPELFGERIVGVALVSTSTGKMAEVTLGLPALLARLRAPVLPQLMDQARRRTRMAERSRQVGGDLVWLFIRRLGFGSKEVSGALVDYVAEIIAGTPIQTLADFYEALMAHDKLGALPVLRGLPVLVLVGDRDLITPPDHSRAIAAELPDAELVVLENAGHMVMLERAALVTLHLRTFLHRAYRHAAGTGRRRRRKA